MTALNTTKWLVKAILEADERTRNSDSFLYFKVIEYIEQEKGEPMLGMTVDHFLTHINELPVPPFESVRRTRQKVQAEFPHLAACDKVAEYRAENEEAYREFARG